MAAAVKENATLQSLELDLQGTNIGDDGDETFIALAAAFKENATLQSLEPYLGDTKPGISVVDIGNAGWDAQDDTILEPDTSKTISVFPLQDHHAALRAAFQKDILDAIRSNSKLTDAEKHFEGLDNIFVKLSNLADFSVMLC